MLHGLILRRGLDYGGKSVDAAEVWWVYVAERVRLVGVGLLGVSDICPRPKWHGAVGGNRPKDAAALHSVLFFHACRIEHRKKTPKERVPVGGLPLS